MSTGRAFIVATAVIASLSLFATMFVAPNPQRTDVVSETQSSVELNTERREPPLPEPPPTIRLRVVGDVMLDRNVRRRMNEFGESYPFTSFFNGDDADADLTIGNLEGAISVRRQPIKSIDFAFESTVTPELKKHFSAMSLANNHSLDQGEQGHQDTEAALAAAGIGYFGHQVRDDGAPWVATVHGKTIAFFGYNTTDNVLDAKDAKRAIGEAGEQYDYVVVMTHWGAEYVPRPHETIVALGRQFVDWGADVVIGAHPHVTQGMEVYRQRPIFWSLGNFIFDQDWSDETQQGMTLLLELGDDGGEAQLVPVWVKESRPERVSGEVLAARLKAFAERSSLPEDLAADATSGSVHWSW